MDVFKKIKNLQIWRIAPIGCKALKPLDTTLLDTDRRRDRLNPHPERHLSVNPSPHRANPHPDQRRDRQPKPRRAHPSPDRYRDRQPKPRRVLPKLFLSFLLWRTERERRTEGENGEERESRGKKI